MPIEVEDNYMARAFAPAIAIYTEQVHRATWGHLAPEPARVYVGEILFAHGEYGDIVPLRVNFKDLPDSPWFFEGMNEFIASRPTTPGKVYRFTGTYRQLRNGRHRFSGYTRLVRI